MRAPPKGSGMSWGEGGRREGKGENGVRKEKRKKK